MIASINLAARPAVLVALSLLAAELLAPASAWSQGAPVAEFVSERVYVIEDSGLAEVPISLTGTAYSLTSVSARTVFEPGVGTADLDDYVDTGGFALWQRFESGIRNFYFEVREDSDVEPDETVYVDLVPSTNGLYVLGERTRCEVVILNDDGELRPYFEALPPYRLNLSGAAIQLADEDETVELNVRINAPAPAGYSASYQVDGGPILSLPFSEGSTSAALLIGPPPTPLEGFLHGQREIELIDPVIARRDAPFRRTIVGWMQVADDCFACAVQGAIWAMGGAEEFPYACTRLPRAAAAPEDALIPALQDYRDNVLATTDAGQFYITLYSDLSPALYRESFRNPWLFFELLDARTEWGSGFAALASGTGNNYVISPSMQGSLTRILDHLETSGDAAILEAVQRERTRLMLDAVEGLTMDQFQNRLETLGGRVRVENTSSLSTLKTRYPSPGQ
jgi:hypothetical protein